MQDPNTNRQLFPQEFLHCPQIQDVAVEQEKTIELLRKEIKLMSGKIHEMSDQLEGDIPNRKPPHY